MMVASGHEPSKSKSKYSKELAAQRDRQRENNYSRLEKVVDEPIISDGREFINSYDYYGDNLVQRN